MSKTIKNALILMAITLVAGLMLGLVYKITEAPIALQSEKSMQEAFAAVFPEGELSDLYETTDELSKTAQEALAEGGFTSDSIDSAYMMRDTDDNPLGLVMNITTSAGYGGDINFSMGIQKDGTINGISILSISETAGLGMKAAEESFYGQYAGKNVDAFVVTKNGASADNEIDALSGATITTNAVTDGVNAGICFFQKLAEGGTFDE